MCCETHTLRLRDVVTSVYLAEPGTALHRTLVAAARRRHTTTPVVVLGLSWRAVKEPVDQV